MTRRNALQCIHEPFGDAFYYGPERLSSRFEDDEQARLDSGFSETTFQKVFNRIDDEEEKEVGYIPTVSLHDIEYATLPCSSSTTRTPPRAEPVP